jgi:hypothetical protein
MVNTRQRSQLNRMLAVLVGTSISLWLLIGCTSPTPVIPPAEQFTQPAVGLPLPRITGDPMFVPGGSSGVVFYNQKITPIRVAISNTITTITPTQGFLFVVSPGLHDFYVYEIDGPASIRSEQVEADKVRYVYVLPLTMQNK